MAWNWTRIRSNERVQSRFSDGIGLDWNLARISIRGQRIMFRMDDERFHGLKVTCCNLNSQWMDEKEARGQCYSYVIPKNRVKVPNVRTRPKCEEGRSRILRYVSMFFLTFPHHNLLP